MPNHVYCRALSRTLLLLRNLLAALILLGLPIASLAQGDIYGAAISLETAKKVAAGAIEEARKNNFFMAIAIVDNGGNLVYFEKLDDTQITSIEIALSKARSANNFKRPTKALEDAVNGGKSTVMALPGAIPIEGGIPIYDAGKIIGAIGVSGGSSEQDGAVATAGIRAVLK